MKTKLFTALGLLLCSVWLTGQNIVTVHYFRPVVPVLAGKDNNPVGMLKVIKDAGEKVQLGNIGFSFDGTTDLNDLLEISMYGSNEKGLCDVSKLIAKSMVSAPLGSFRLNVPLEKDTSVFWFTVKTRDKIVLSNRINVNCISAATSAGKARIATEPFKEGLRVGVALRQHKQDGVHTTRIPGLATTRRGTLIAVYDARWDSSRDLQGDIDIAINRSFDQGQTWQPMQIVLNMKEFGGLPEKYNGVSDACILVDENSDAIYIAGLWMHGVLDRNTGKWVEGLTNDSTRWIHQWHTRGSQPGLGIKETSQFLITKSTDDGKTWSEPTNITSRTKRPEWWLYAPAPGHGITLNDSTMVFPTQGRDKNGMPFSNITWSKDGGKTWTTSNPAYSDVTESMAVQLTNGSIMLNMRDNRNNGNTEKNGRRVCITNDLGKTWKEHPTSNRVLTEPTCMASLHKHTYTAHGQKKTLLAFSNPNSYKYRNNMTLKLSFDDGMTWPEKYWVLLDEWGGFGYSCITSIDENTLGIVYEGSQAQLVFQQVKISELLK